ncbi:MAG: galactose oxidase [Ferruginibacter sp.]|nr:galactose oxidase [Ferruginibacter sp.]
MLFMKPGIYHRFFFINLFFFFILFSNQGYSQSYGLGFYSHEVVQDKRTSLDLFPGKGHCFQDDFDISFEVAFLPDHIDYFGYIFRLIKDDKLNIDLIYDKRFMEKKHFKVVIGGKLSNIAFDIDNVSLFKKWNKFRLSFDLKNNRLTFYTEKNSFIQDGIGLAGGNCFKFYFGANQYEQFKITDVPPMKVRNIQIKNKGALQFSWPLDEKNGNVGHDLIGKMDAAVNNPIWIKNAHYDWKLLKEFSINGAAAVTFNSKKELLYIVGVDSLLSYSPADTVWTWAAYKTGKINIIPGNLVVSNDNTNELYELCIDKKLVSTLNIAKGEWDHPGLPGVMTDYLHLNKFYSPADSSLYLVGGYGQFQYKNAIFKYHIPSRSWQNITTSGDSLIPRYLSAAGTNASGDTAYILGGYGSLTGQQILNPQCIYDMMLFDVKNRKIKKIFEITRAKEDFVFANSLVIDARSKTYFGLVFPNYKYNSELQLIKGSLLDGSFQFLGNKIPYLFHDTHSFADLYYCQASNKFLAVTLLRENNNRTRVNVYSLEAPPVGSDFEVVVLPVKRPGTLYYILFSFVIAGGFIYWLYRKKKGYGLPGLPALLRKEEEHVNKITSSAGVIGSSSFSRTDSEELPPTGNKISSEVFVPVNGSFSEMILPADDEIRLHDTSGQKAGPPIKKSIFLFGEMQIYDKNGNDITRQFTPLLKELFLIILLFSIRKERGVSSDKLIELLWSGKSAESARNNRSVNIAKLKLILDKMEHCQLSKETGFWKIDIDYNYISVDYQDYLGIVANKKNISKQNILKLTRITQRGSFLTSIEHEWLDSFKSEVSNEIIDTYLHYAESVKIADDPDFLIQLTNFIFYFDPVNEDAMLIKCKALSHLGKHSLAKNAFEAYCKEYRLIYGEDFKKDFQSIIE